MRSQYIFVYGTLRRGVNSKMNQLLSDHGEYLCRGETSGKLYALDGYPGMIASSDKKDKVFGEIYKITSSKLLILLDDYEECSDNFPLPHEYIRKQLPVRLIDGTQLNAWVYLYNHNISNLMEIKSGDYVKHLRESQKQGI